MKAVLVEQIGSFRLADLPVPEPGPGEVRVRVTVTGLCRTDLKIVRSGHRDLVLPRVPGEEVVGVVERCGGDAVAWREGQRVYVYPGEWCGGCEACRRGHENLCRRMRIMGFHRDGGFAAQVAVPAKSLIAVPNGLSDERAVFAEPLSCCLNALELARVSAGMRVGIWGGGTAGTLLARAAAARGAAPTVIEPDPARRGRIGGLERPPSGERYDVCIPAVGAAEAYREALAHLAPQGVLVLFSGLSKAEQEQPVDLNELHYRQQTLVGAYGCCFRHGAEALEMLAAGTVRVDDLVTHRLPLERLDEGLSLVERRAGMKVLLKP